MHLYLKSFVWIKFLLDREGRYCILRYLFEIQCAEVMS